MSRKDDVKGRLKLLTAVVGDNIITKTPVEISVASLTGVNGQIAILLAELVDEMSAIRKDLDELNQDIKRIERNIGKK